jgi:hypothetical protein
VRRLDSGLFSGVAASAPTVEKPKNKVRQGQTNERSSSLKPASSGQARSEKRATNASAGTRTRNEAIEESTRRGKPVRHAEQEGSQRDASTEILSKERRQTDDSDLHTTEVVAPRRGPLGLFGRRRMIRGEITAPEVELPPASYE